MERAVLHNRMAVMAKNELSINTSCLNKLFQSPQFTVYF